MNEKTAIKRVIQAAERAKKHEELLRERREAKRWSPFTLPLSLHAALNRLTKDELLTIGRTLLINGLTAKRKAELIEALETDMPNYLSKIFILLPPAIRAYLEEIMESPDHVVIVGEDDFYPDFLGECGILFRGSIDGEPALAIPVEIVRMYASWQPDRPEDNLTPKEQEWVRLTQGLLYYYGVLTTNELTGMLSRYTGETVEADELARVLEADGRESIVPYRGGYYFEIVSSPEEVKQEQQIRSNLEFYPLTKEQLIEAGDDNFIEQNSASREFVDILLKYYKIQRFEAEDIVSFMIYHIMEGGDIAGSLSMLTDHLEISEDRVFNKIVDALVALHNGTRQYSIKGWSPNELSAQRRTNEPVAVMANPPWNGKVIQLSAGAKIGRNDPCPCGSGKKYKKCCGS